MAAPAAVVEIDTVGKRFAATGAPALDAVSAGIRPGEITGLVGPDGAGKTTLIRLIAGLMRPTDGRIRVDGLDSVRDAAAIQARIGYMPQRFGLYQDLTVQENLKLYADLRGLVGTDRRDTFARLLAFTRLEAFVDRLAGRLSGGMKQKLGLACALLQRPQLLLLDEPSVGVDPISRRELWSMVQDLVSGDVAVIWSTAYLDEAERCDTVLLLNAGQLLFDGPPHDLTRRVEGRTIQVQGMTERRRPALKRALRLPGVIDGVVQGRNLRLVLAPGTALPAPDAIGAGASARMVAVTPRFEDAFMDVLGGGPGGESRLADKEHAITDDGAEVIRADGLTRRFGDFTAADRITFAIRRGEIFGLLGPNGAGKSTTFKMLCGLLPPSDGQGQVAGHDLRTAAAQARARIGYMAQTFSLYGDLSVAQNLAFFAGAYGLTGRRRRERVALMVETFDLEPHLGASAKDLPLGFKQRLSLACATMHEPEVLFLDEPTSGVDPVTRREFWSHINGLVEKGVTILVTTHFMEEAEYCDRIALIYRGQTIATGAPDALKAQVADPDTPDPTLEDAFIALVEASDDARAAA